jgi:hypothetical protein
MLVLLVLLEILFVGLENWNDILGTFFC